LSSAVTPSTISAAGSLSTMPRSVEQLAETVKWRKFPSASPVDMIETDDAVMVLVALPGVDLDKTEALTPAWFEWQRLGGNIGLKGGHAFGDVWDKYHVEHPEWFALQHNGSRDLSKLSPQRARLCKSNLALIDALARDKTEEMQARASAMDELIAGGTLEDFTSGGDTQLDRELAQLTSKSKVDDELEKMKAEIGSGSESKELPQ